MKKIQYGRQSAILIPIVIFFTPTTCPIMLNNCAKLFQNPIMHKKVMKRFSFSRRTDGNSTNIAVSRPS